MSDTVENSRTRFDAAIQRFDAENAKDPNRLDVAGVPRPKELVYAGRISRWVEKLDPGASEALRLAARAQHLCRWKIPRANFPMTKAGYLAWRTALYDFHAELASSILRDVGYGEAIVGQVSDLLRKKNLTSNGDMQTLEDAATLTFLKYEFVDFAQRADMTEAKLIRILQKTWKKMSLRGRAEALTIELPPGPAAILARALG